MRSILILLALLSTPSCFTTLRSPATFAPEQLETAAFDHALWADVLAAHVDAQGRVDYDGLRADRDALDRYVALLAAAGPSTHPHMFATRDDRLAYAINAYNALVLFNVIERPALSSVNDVRNDFFYFTRFPLDGEVTSLYDLENEIRAEFGDPRIHFALNCASRGCPRLPTAPFEGPVLQRQLTAEETRFLREERNVAVDDGVIVLSEIFDWFGEDFAGGPVDWIRSRTLNSTLPADAPVRFRPWDWRLNAQVSDAGG